MHSRVTSLAGKPYSYVWPLQTYGFCCFVIRFTSIQRTNSVFNTATFICTSSMILLHVKMESMLRLTKSSLVCSVQFSQGFSRTIILSSIHSIKPDFLDVTFAHEDGKHVEAHKVVLTPNSVFNTATSIDTSSKILLHVKMESS